VVAVRDEESALVISEYGYGKRMAYDQFTPHGRGTKGQIGYTVTQRTGEVVGLLSVKEGDDMVVMTAQGNTVKLELDQIPAYGRQASGVRIVNIESPDFVVGIARSAAEDADEDEAE
jgi:DNA gyrase subunit A